MVFVSLVVLPCDSVAHHGGLYEGHDNIYIVSAENDEGGSSRKGKQKECHPLTRHPPERCSPYDMGVVSPTPTASFGRRRSATTPSPVSCSPGRKPPQTSSRKSSLSGGVTGVRYSTSLKDSQKKCKSEPSRPSPSPIPVPTQVRIELPCITVGRRVERSSMPC